MSENEQNFDFSLVTFGELEEMERFMADVDGKSITFKKVKGSFKGIDYDAIDSKNSECWEFDSSDEVMRV